MNTSNTKPESLAEKALLAHIDRFGLTVVEAVARLQPFQEWHKADVQYLLDRLEAAGTISSSWLYCGRRCYFPAAREARHANHLTHQPAKPVSLSDESKIRRFAMLSFCCLGSAARFRLTPTEVQQRINSKHNRRLATNYYVQPLPDSVVGLLRVDMGGHGRWDRVLAKCLEDAREHVHSPDWRNHLEAGRFEITLATTLPQKAERLRRAFEDLPTQPGVPIRITAIPELLYLIAPPPN